MLLTFSKSAVVLNYLENENKDRGNVGFAFHYFKYNVPDTQSPTVILSSFIKQFCNNFKDIPQHLMDFFHEFDRNMEEPLQERYLSELQKLTADFRNVFVVIDALDECISKREVIMDILFDFARSLPHAKIFITSRKEPDIEARFRREQIPVIQIAAEDVNRDIEVFVRGRCRELIQEQKLRVRSVQLEQKITITLISKAQGM